MLANISDQSGIVLWFQSSILMVSTTLPGRYCPFNWYGFWAGGVRTSFGALAQILDALASVVLHVGASALPLDLVVGVRLLWRRLLEVLLEGIVGKRGRWCCGAVAGH
jgi:hypothetical protein